MSPLFQLYRVNVFRNTKHILKNFSFTLKKNQHTVVFGPNGSGKSTFLKLLTRELKPKYEEHSFIKIQGEELINLFDLRKHIGIVSSDTAFEFKSHPKLTGKEIILSGFFGSIGVYENIVPRHHKQTEEMVKFLEIEDLQEKLFCEMSSGQQKKILLARALVNNPHTLILDEASNALDMVARKKFHQLLQKIMKENITTLVLVTHHPEEILEEIKTVVFIKNGEIFAEGERTQVFTPENISKLFGEEVLLS